MATLGAIAVRRAEAVIRLEAAVKRLASEYGVEVPAAAPRVVQQDLQQVMEVERLAALIESILSATDEKVAETGTSGVDPAVLSGNTTEIKEYLEGVTDGAVLDMLHATEAAYESPRKGVLAAIDKRRAELEPEEEE